MTLTKLLVAVNLLVFVGELASGGAAGGTLVRRYVLYGPAVVDAGQWYRIVTAAFLHGSIPHVALNMFALWQVGDLVEAFVGKSRYALLYALAIAGSGAAVLWANFDQPTLGASGAIFGLFGALVAIGLQLPARGRGLVRQTVPIVVINVVYSFLVPGISVAAHLGGLATGFVAGGLLFALPSQRKRQILAGLRRESVPVRADVETIEQPPHAGPHEEFGAPPEETRSPDDR